MAATSLELTSVNFFSLRMRPCFLVPVKCRLPECARTILPVAVNLKRLAAPRWVFSFFFGLVEFLGICENPLLQTGGQARLRNPSPFYALLDWGAAVPRPYKRTAKSIRPAARLAANWALPPARPFWERAAPPGRCLPCAAWSRSARARQSHRAGASSSRALPPGGPSRGRDGKSWRALCALRRGNE